MTVAVLLLAAQAFVAPKIGCIRETSETVRCVYGVAGAFILGEVEPGRSSSFDRSVMLSDRVAVSIDGAELVVSRSDGRTERVQLAAAPVAIEMMSDQWVHLAGTRRIVRITEDCVEVFVLPRGVRR